MSRKLLIALLSSSIVMAPGVTHINYGWAQAEKKISRVAIFAIPGEGLETNAIAEHAVTSLSEVFVHLGRFEPVEKSKIESALKQIPQKNIEESLKKASESLDCDLMVLVMAARGLKSIYGSMKVIPLSDKYKNLAREFTVESKIPMNIPLKLAREIAYLHKLVPLVVSVAERAGETAYINAGQWHGIAAGSYGTEKGGTMKVLQTGRFKSAVVISGPGAGDESVTIRVYPHVDAEVAGIEDSMRQAVSQKYMIQGQDEYMEDGQRFVVSLIFNNLGANTCLPGIGSYLAVNSLVREDHVSPAGVVLSMGLIATHLTLTGFLTGFNTNFAPWIRDSDKTRAMQRFQIFLWATIPLSLFTSYMDQLAYALSAAEKVPPFYLSGSEAAAALSLFIPGGGLFYKGYRLMGWGYYFAEMFLASYGLYHYGSGNTFMYAYIVLGAVKLIEIIHAYFVNFGYDFIEYEMNRRAATQSFMLGVETINKTDHVYHAGIVLHY